MPRNSADYEVDFYAWTVEQARLLRAGNFAAIDIANVAEEIESMGRSDRRALESRLTVLLTHLLKWRIQSRMRSSSWSGTINEQRRRIAKLLQESPSLRPFLDEVLAEAYGDARDAASNQSGLPEAEFPAECQFTVDQLLSRDFLPEQ
jgi:ribosomal protein L29